MNEIVKPKETSYGYGERSQAKMAAKYRNRANNHWARRISFCQELVRDVPVMKAKPTGETVLADIGCSIGTFAIEFAKLGYRTYGVDFDPVAIRWARQLAEEEKAAATFVQMDVADWGARDLPKIDIAVCFDIFEHLHDDELGALLQSLRRQLAPGGSVVFSTTPTQFSYMYSGGSRKLAVVRAFVYPLTFLGPKSFPRAFRAFAGLMDALLLLFRGKDHRELIKQEKHCNPLTRERLEDIFRRAGYRLDRIETLDLHPLPGRFAARLRKHAICHSHIVGVASRAA
jgi:2-polyprenyl-3-methyl-5-hydroxy-6-metoxy-1,4-benzoquinol methylase